MVSVFPPFDDEKGMEALFFFFSSARLEFFRLARIPNS